VPTPVEVRQLALRHGRDKKRKNATAAVLCGVGPAVFLSVRSNSASTWESWLVGIIVGLIWGNAFEYVYHRWLLHRPRSPMGAGHHEHHAHIGTPEEAEHVALITSSLNVILLFVINGVPAFLIASRMGLWGILSGVFIGWSAYLIVTEEIHWRIHINGSLPRGLRFARTYHMSHHDIPTKRYNVFLPLFDFLFGSMRPGRSKMPIQTAGS
jgi:hypothetical protein